MIFKIVKHNNFVISSIVSTENNVLTRNKRKRASYCPLRRHKKATLLAIQIIMIGELWFLWSWFPDDCSSMTIKMLFAKCSPNTRIVIFDQRLRVILAADEHITKWYLTTEIRKKDNNRGKKWGEIASLKSEEVNTRTKRGMKYRNHIRERENMRHRNILWRGWKIYLLRSILKYILFILFQHFQKFWFYVR